MSENKLQPGEKIELSDEFKKDLKNRKKTPWVGITIISILGLAVFLSLGIGTYQIFFKADNSKQTNNAKKIVSRPEATTQKVGQVSKPAATVTAPPSVAATPQTYTVQAGDTLSGIAAKYNTTSQAVASYNNIADPNSILSIGQILKIPN